MIDIKDIEAFLCILDEGSISRAAEKMGITQPALSLKLKKMETELGVPLFQRTPRAMVPLETCRSIEAVSRDILVKLESVKESLANRISDLSGAVRIGCLTGWVNVLALPLVQKAREETPNLSFKIEVGQTGELLRAVSLGQLDLAIVAKPFEHVEGVTCKHLLDEQLILVGNNLPEMSAPQDFQEELLTRQWITLNSSDSLVNRYWSEAFGEEFPWEKIKKPVTLNHIYSIRSFVAQLSDTVAVLPSQVVMLERGGDLSLERHLSIPQRNGVFLVWRENGLELRRFRFAADALIEIATGVNTRLLSSQESPKR